jgi:hypothetical protein
MGSGFEENRILMHDFSSRATSINERESDRYVSAIFNGARAFNLEKGWVDNGLF